MRRGSIVALLGIGLIAGGVATAVAGVPTWLPEGRSVELYMRSLDVIHSVFVPQFGQKEDVVPGLVTQLHITPDRLGTYPVECTELCGLGHSLMRTQAIVMKPAAFETWLRQQSTQQAKKG